MVSNKEDDLDLLCREIFTTDKGKQLLGIFKELYVNVSCLADTPELTYYRLGQKELIQAIIDNVENDSSTNVITE